MAIVSFLLVVSVVRFCNGFLLETKNSTSTAGKSVYLTVAEYYGDRNQIHHETETYRTRQEKTLQLLATQLQQRLEAMEQKIDGRNETQQLAMKSLELQNQELEQKYSTLKKTQDDRERSYQELEQKYSALKKTQDDSERSHQELEQKYSALKKTQDERERSCQELEQNYTQLQKVLTNKTETLEHKIYGLEQLKSVNQLKDIHTLQQNMQSFNSKINLLTSHEQARNQDFLALYNMTTASRSEIHTLANKTSKRFDILERNHNNSVAALQNADRKIDTLNNFTSTSRSKMNAFVNSTSKQLELLAHNLNSSFSAPQQNIDQINKKVVLTSCRNSDSYINTGSVITFPTIKTVVGISNPSSFTSTGKFTCQVPGVYFISIVLTSLQNNLYFYIMKNSVQVHKQYINGYANGYWTPGATAIALELRTNDTVWVQYQSNRNRIYFSCITIFKI